VEVSNAVVSLNILDTKLDLAVRKVFVILEISKAYLNNASLESLGSDLGTSCLGNNGLSEFLGGEHGRSLKLVPFFLEERILTIFLVEEKAYEF
jgi:hypothetical protein